MGDHIIYHLHQDTLENKRSAINNRTGTTDINWDCPGNKQDKWSL